MSDSRETVLQFLTASQAHSGLPHPACVEIAHVCILLGIDPRIGEEHGQVIDVELHGRSSVTESGTGHSLFILACKNRALKPVAVVQAFGNATPAFGSSLAPSSFGSASSSLSYLAESPDLTSISDPGVVVNFKNTLKKDGTTKAKALEELLRS
ncbi:hypothetical protein MRB53_038496 [Persea americana]|nr:hypothetical protein MRB53_038496 [Persea americana]